MLLTLTDESQNIAYDSIPITIDVTPPRVSGVSSLPDYRNGQTIRYTLTFTEWVNWDEELSTITLLSEDSTVPLQLDLIESASTDLVFVYETIVDEAANGIGYTLQVAEWPILVDKAQNNLVFEPADAETLNVDGTIPNFSSLSLEQNNNFH